MRISGDVSILTLYPEIETWRVTFINCDSYVVRDVKLPNIYNVITRVRYAINSFIIIAFIIIIKKIEASTSTIEISIEVSAQRDESHYLATSAYVSIAFMDPLFFSAIGMMVFLTPKRSPTFSNASCRKVRRYPSK